ncbi:DUF4231 domain-containing protein [Deefgea tanakiae]|uniref:DUF4231 domain-containing protein n=1 Tax=Deefgea tanakiae TaxID=2865840 RepID=A0ABX8Z8T1_9NEIS|nr:DUF4231 domain-containing protein [Deefgea tanakiae]QZA78722.1 DUF4231 domain-containing protein [Deefgea tanakiae]
MDHEITQTVLKQHPNLKVRFLLSKILKYQQYSQTKSKNLKRTTYCLKFSMLALATGTTIVLGLDVAGLQPHAKNIALVLGAIMTFLGGISSFLNIEEYWMRNNATNLRLKSIRDRLIYLTGDLQEIEDTTLQTIINDYQAITESNIHYWYDAISERQGA